MLEVKVVLNLGRREDAVLKKALDGSLPSQNARLI
jgi:hypothetical protein